MLDQTHNVPRSASEILGDLTALTEQLGGTEGLSQLTSSAAWLGMTRIEDLPGLENFLASYRSSILIPHELPSILRAYHHTVRSEARELIALDNQLRQVPILERFATASGTVGKIQLRRLGPLRGERVAQRYLKAVEEGRANAWHTVVYGLVLGIYSLPLRQGMIHFAHQTLGGFVEAARDRLKLPALESQRLLDAQTQSVVAAVERTISRQCSMAALQS